jgi:dolichol kinase
VLILHTIVIILSDTLAAFIGYSFSEKLKRLFVRKKKKNDIEKSHKRIEK